MAASDENTHLEKLAFDLAPIGLVMAEDRIILACNVFFAEMFGYRKDELISQEFSVLYPSYNEFLSIGNRVRQHPDIANYWDERIMQRKSGELFWCRARSNALTPDDPLKRAVYSFADLSIDRPVQKLTPREREIVSLLVEGRTSKEIARELELSHRTIEVYRARLLKKFHAVSTTKLLQALSVI